MASRQEEKERRRKEREQKEREAAATQSRKRRTQTIGGGMIAVAAAIGVAVAVAGSGGGGGSGSSGSKTGRPVGGAAIPAPKISDLTAAAKAAGCAVNNYPNFGQTHTTGKVTYKSNPPTSGDHSPIPASDGIYDPGKEPAAEHFVHSLEHGRVELQYRPGTPTGEIAQLVTLFNEPLASKTGEPAQAGYKKLLFQNDTGMPYAVAETAWQHSITCPTLGPQVFDALRDFAVKFVDTAPESAAIRFPE